VSFKETKKKEREGFIERRTERRKERKKQKQRGKKEKRGIFLFCVFVLDFGTEKEERVVCAFMFFLFVKDCSPFFLSLLCLTE